MGDWKNPYRTLDKEYEVRQLQVFHNMMKKGYIYRQDKPVYWSPSSRTALAEAELEYRDDHQSNSVYVKLPVINSSKH
ncbi:Aminoacyl-tRNA synthetase [Rhizophagus irregularis]|nr:Aminoacyl-tRNA synthetase [Rhizophagus irregularis]